MDYMTNCPHTHTTYQARVDPVDAVAPNVVMKY